MSDNNDDETKIVNKDKGEEEEEEEEEESKEAKTEGSKRKRKRKRKKKAVEEEPAVDDEEEEEQQAEDHTASVECTVYVEGIPFDASPNDVRAFFETNGSITDIRDLRLPTWQDSGRLRGYGHVLFGSQESYDKALSLSGKHMGKRYLTIQPSNAPKNGGGGGNSSGTSFPDPNEPPPENCKTLFVNNLPYAALEEDIETAFGRYGNVEGVRIARNSINRQSKGFAYVDFCTPEDAQKVVKACSKKRLVVNGRAVRIDYDTGRMKGSFRGESGRLYTKEKTASTTTTKERKRHRSN